MFALFRLCRVPARAVASTIYGTNIGTSAYQSTGEFKSTIRQRNSWKEGRQRKGEGKKPRTEKKVCSLWQSDPVNRICFTARKSVGAMQRTRFARSARRTAPASLFAGILRAERRRGRK